MGMAVRRTFLPRGQDASKCVQMLEHAHSLLPSNTQILDLAAACYVANGDVERARKLVDRVVAWSSHSGNREERVATRMKQLIEEYSRAAGQPDA